MCSFIIAFYIGENLTCLACSDLPNNTLTYVANTSCSNPIRQKCSYRAVRTGELVQDRCITLKVRVRQPVGADKVMLFKNCSEMAHCMNSNEVWAVLVNRTMGTSPETRAQCCVGRGYHRYSCNTGFVAQSKTGLIWSAILTAMIIMSWN